MKDIVCSRISINGDHARYQFGPSPENMTGLVRIYPQAPRFAVEQQPIGQAIPDSLLVRVWLKYREQISKGAFPEKMAVQVG